MAQPQEQLNRFMVENFHHVLRAEERLLRRQGYADLSVSEMHVLEAIRFAEQSGANNARGIADLLRITPGSLTAAVNVLEKKGYVARGRGGDDRRRVYICLTDKGLAADDDHRRVHARLVEEVLNRLTEEEARALGSALEAISNFFNTEGATSP